jgi:hypothetical protein
MLSDLLRFNSLRSHSLDKSYRYKFFCVSSLDLSHGLFPSEQLSQTLIAHSFTASKRHQIVLKIIVCRPQYKPLLFCLVIAVLADTEQPLPSSCPFSSSVSVFALYCLQFIGVLCLLPSFLICRCSPCFPFYESTKICSKTPCFLLGHLHFHHKIITIKLINCKIACDFNSFVFVP